MVARGAHLRVAPGSVALHVARDAAKDRSGGGTDQSSLPTVVFATVVPHNGPGDAAKNRTVDDLRPKRLRGRSREAGAKGSG